MLDIFTRRLAQIVAIGTGITGIIVTLQGSTTTGLVLGVLSVITSFYSFYTDYRKRHFLERWYPDDL